MCTLNMGRPVEMLDRHDGRPTPGKPEIGCAEYMGRIMNLRLLVLTAAIFGWCGQSWAADRCVAAIGTATTGSCAGTCNATDFATAATCYPSTATGLQNAMIASTTTGDTVTLDDGTHNVVAGVNSFSMTMDGGGLLTIRCRTATQGSCTVSGSSATGAVFLLNDTTQVQSFEFQNLRITKTATHTDTARPALIHVAGVTAGVTLDGVTLGPATVDVTGGGTWTRGVVEMDQALSQTLTVENGTIATDISVTGDDITGILHADSPTDIVITGTLADPGLIINDIVTVNASGGLIYSEDALTASGVTLDGWTSTATGVVVNYGLFFGNLTAVMTLDDISVSNVTMSGDNPRGALAFARYGYTMSDLYCTNITSTTADSGNGIGGCVTISDWATETKESGTIRRITCDNVNSNYGACVYYTNGGAGRLYNLIAINSSSYQGIGVYKGGDGDVEITDCVIVGNTQTDGGTAALREGALLYMHSHPTTTDRASTHGVYHCTATNNTLISSATGSIAVKNNNSGAFALTAELINNIFRNGKATEIYVDNSATLTLNLTSSNLTDKDDPISREGAGTYNETLTNNIETDPLFVSASPVNANGAKLSSGSASRRVGLDLNIGNIQDAGNRAFMHPPSIGAWEATSGDAATTRTAR